MRSLLAQLILLTTNVASNSMMFNLIIVASNSIMFNLIIIVSNSLMFSSITVASNSIMFNSIIQILPMYKEGIKLFNFTLSKIT